MLLSNPPQRQMGYLSCTSWRIAILAFLIVPFPADASMTRYGDLSSTLVVSIYQVAQTMSVMTDVIQINEAGRIYKIRGWLCLRSSLVCSQEAVRHCLTTTRARMPRRSMISHEHTAKGQINQVIDRTFRCLVVGTLRRLQGIAHIETDCQLIHHPTPNRISWLVHIFHDPGKNIPPVDNKQLLIYRLINNLLAVGHDFH